MSKRILIRSVVDRQLAEFYAFILQDKVAPAERFLEVADESFQRLAEMPSIGRQWDSADPELADIRSYPMPVPYRSYIIYYRPIADGIEILLVEHGARDIKHITDSLLDGF